MAEGEIDVSNDVATLIFGGLRIRQDHLVEPPALPLVNDRGGISAASQGSTSTALKQTFRLQMALGTHPFRRLNKPTR